MAPRLLLGNSMVSLSILFGPHCDHCPAAVQVVLLNEYVNMFWEAARGKLSVWGAKNMNKNA